MNVLKKLAGSTGKNSYNTQHNNSNEKETNSILFQDMQKPEDLSTQVTTDNSEPIVSKSQSLPTPSNRGQKTEILIKLGEIIKSHINDPENTNSVTVQELFNQLAIKTSPFTNSGVPELRVAGNAINESSLNVTNSESLIIACFCVFISMRQGDPESVSELFQHINNEQFYEFPNNTRKDYYKKNLAFNVGIIPTQNTDYAIFKKLQTALTLYRDGYDNNRIKFYTNLKYNMLEIFVAFGIPATPTKLTAMIKIGEIVTRNIDNMSNDISKPLAQQFNILSKKSLALGPNTPYDPMFNAINYMATHLPGRISNTQTEVIVCFCIYIHLKQEKGSVPKTSEFPNFSEIADFINNASSKKTTLPNTPPTNIEEEKSDSDKYKLILKNTDLHLEAFEYKNIEYYKNLILALQLYQDGQDAKTITQKTGIKYDMYRVFAAFGIKRNDEIMSVLI